jgi:predicted phage terminase large subunit-like protein
MNERLLSAMRKYRANEKRVEWLACLENLYKEDAEGTYPLLKEFRSHVQKNVSDDPRKNMDLLKRAYTISARDRFDDFMIAMEWDRPSKQKFYLPRRKGLIPVVEALQGLADDFYDVVCISLPPGVGKTATALFFCDFLAGRNPLDGILISSHNNSFLMGAYKECIRELSTPEYRFGEIFPGKGVVETNAKDLQIAVEKPQRFPTFQFTSIEAGNAGKVRAIQLLYCDDLIDGIEEALSVERLNAKWNKYAVDLKQRKQDERCKELHIATRWSVHDIIGRIEDNPEPGVRYKFINIPAYNSDGESNFPYLTKEYFERQASTMDELSFKALYMGEPVEREGLLYETEGLRRYYSLPEGDPDAVLAVVDTAEGGGDDTVMPIFAVYGNDHYLIDGVCSDALPEVTNELLTDAICRSNVRKCQFEGNSGGTRAADRVDEKVRAKGFTCQITKKKTTQNKQTKIIVESEWIKRNVLFPASPMKGTAVYQMIEKLCTYTVKGKNKHDDVPDAFAQYSIFYESTFMQRGELVSRKKYGI